ncbi:hypothetical protein NDU88_001591 [Pleurodeles waltl]|uniref:Uncharacterized protein n=1 Tax=Pleurodeles waltl TaxID=8319 RepID=A0AAV7PBM9_PLEWA|nr:hypothetical protein NDU88_001591 [Pleurodeles waltl]
MDTSVLAQRVNKLAVQLTARDNRSPRQHKETRMASDSPSVDDFLQTSGLLEEEEVLGAAKGLLCGIPHVSPVYPPQVPMAATPPCLLNAGYELLMKIWAIGITSLAQDLIQKNQAGFVAGWLMAANINFLVQALDYIAEKAFDLVN